MVSNVLAIVLCATFIVDLVGISSSAAFVPIPDSACNGVIHHGNTIKSPVSKTTGSHKHKKPG